MRDVPVVLSLQTLVHCWLDLPALRRSLMSNPEPTGSHDPLAEIERIRETLGSLISWMAQSANSPISRDEAKKPLEMLEVSHGR